MCSACPGGSVTWAVYAHGSYFAGHADARDVDVLVVTDADLSREEAGGKVAPLLDGVSRALPLDVAVVDPSALSTIHRAIVHTGRLLDGEPVACPPVSWVEWAGTMTALAQQQGASEPGAAALAALRALWAAEGRVVAAKSSVPAEAAGTPWEGLALAAWEHRHAPTFEHPDLAAALEAAAWAAAGEAASGEWQTRGWSHLAHRRAVLTIYRNVLTPAEVGGLVAVPAEREQHGGWRKAAVDEPEVTAALLGVAEVANAYWWRLPLTGMEYPDLHRHGPGSTFPAHVDRLPMYPGRAHNIVAMLQPAERGGQLYLDLGGERIEPDLRPGDVVVFDSGHLHGVSEVEAGERVVLVAHTAMEVR